MEKDGGFPHRLFHDVFVRSGRSSGRDQNEQKQRNDNAASRRRGLLFNNDRFHYGLGHATRESGGSSARQGSGENEFLHVNLQILHATEYFRGRWRAPKLYLVILS